MLEKPPITPEMSARETEDMVDSMLRDSPLSDTERGDHRLPEEVEATSFQRRRMAGSFLREAMGSCLKRPLQVNLYHLVLRKYFLFALSLVN